MYCKLVDNSIAIDRKRWTTPQIATLYICPNITST